MSDPALGLLMLCLIVVVIMMGFPTAFTLMGLGIVFGFMAYFKSGQFWWENGVFDLMVCNPPYVRSGDIAALEPEVRAFDPPAALDGGSDGLRMFRRLAPRVPAVVPNGWAVFEVGCDQAEAVARPHGHL